MTLMGKHVGLISPFLENPDGSPEAYWQQAITSMEPILGSFVSKNMEPAVGIEPTACGLRNRCSTPELRWRILRLYLKCSYKDHPNWSLEYGIDSMIIYRKQVGW